MAELWLLEYARGTRGTWPVTVECRGEERAREVYAGWVRSLSEAPRRGAYVRLRRDGQVVEEWTGEEACDA